MRKTLSSILILAMALFAVPSCLSDSDELTPSSGSSSSGGSDSGSDDSDEGGVEDVDPYNDEDEIEDEDFSEEITITYSSSGASVSNSSFQSSYVTVSGNSVTVNYTGSSEIAYILTGSASDGYFKLYSEARQKITLSSLTLTNTKGAAINNQSGKRTYIVLNGASTLKDGSSYTLTPSDEDEKAAFFSEGPLIFSGSGSLAVTATGKAGITSDDYLKFTEGTVTVSSSAGHGLRGKDAVLVAGGTLNVTASANMKKGISSDGYVQFDGGATTITVSGSAAYDSDDGDYTGTAGIKADGNFVINAGTLTITNSGTGGKGINVDGYGYFYGGEIDITVSGANYGSSSGGGMGPGGGSSSSNSVSAKGIKCDNDIIIGGSTITVNCTNSSGHEGIESKSELTMTSGNVYVCSAADDAINCSGNMVISGGYLYAHSEGNDAVDANQNLTISGGVVIAEGAGAPENGLDAAEGYNIFINGGIVIATGGSTAQTSSSSSQASVETSNISKNTVYALYDSEGSTPIVAYNTKNIVATAFMISSPSLSSGSSYVLKSGASVTSYDYVDINDSGILSTTAGHISGGSGSTTLTAAYQVGSGMGGGGGTPGGGGNPGGGNGGGSQPGGGRPGGGR